MRSMIPALLALVALAGTAPAISHHSTANFDQTKRITVTGKVTFFRMTSPHSHIDIEVPVAGGAPQTYKLFTVARTVMARSGWKSEYINVGDEVTATGNPDRTDPTLLNLSVIVFANGKTWTWDSIL